MQSYVANQSNSKTRVSFSVNARHFIFGSSNNSIRKLRISYSVYPKIGFISRNGKAKMIGNFVKIGQIRSKSVALLGKRSGNTEEKQDYEF